MIPEQITEQLERLASAEDFPTRSSELVEQWASANVGAEVVEPILRFMEAHPSIDFGLPGSLVHFVEGFYRRGYEEKLIESVYRKPTRHSIWMLNRIINGTKDPDAKRQLIRVMVGAKSNTLADSNTVSQINHLLERFGLSGA